MGLSDAFGTLALVAIVTAVTALVFGPSIWGLIDVSRIPDSAWATTEHKKSSWTAVFAVGTWLWIVGLPAAILYLRTVRPELHAAMAAAGTPPPPPLRSNRTVVVVAGSFAVLWMLGLWAYLVHGH